MSSSFLLWVIQLSVSQVCYCTSLLTHTPGSNPNNVLLWQCPNIGLSWFPILWGEETFVHIEENWLNMGPLTTEHLVPNHLVLYIGYFLVPPTWVSRQATRRNPKRNYKNGQKETSLAAPVAAP